MVEDGRRVQAAKPDQEQTAWRPGLTIRQSKCVHVGAATDRKRFPPPFPIGRGSERNTAQ